VEAAYKDMGHYGKAITAEAIKMRYLTPSDCWREGVAILEACIPCQLYKRPQNTQPTVTIHPYGIKGNYIKDWNLYLRQTLFAFAAHKNERLNATPFFLQYDVESILPSTSLTANTISRVDLAEATESHRQHVQDLSKYRSEAAKKYQITLERIASDRDDSYFKSPIILGDLVMRESQPKNENTPPMG
jgi:hypothetical protein